MIFESAVACLQFHSGGLVFSMEDSVPILCCGVGIAESVGSSFTMFFAYSEVTCVIPAAVSFQSCKHSDCSLILLQCCSRLSKGIHFHVLEVWQCVQDLQGISFGAWPFFS